MFLGGSRFSGLRIRVSFSSGRRSSSFQFVSLFDFKELEAQSVPCPSWCFAFLGIQQDVIRADEAKDAACPSCCPCEVSPESAPCNPRARSARGRGGCPVSRLAPIPAQGGAFPVGHGPADRSRGRDCRVPDASRVIPSHNADTGPTHSNCTTEDSPPDRFGPAFIHKVMPISLIRSLILNPRVNP